MAGSVLDYSPYGFRRIWGLIASPPCQTFSQAGKGSGRKDLDRVLACIELIEKGEDYEHLLEGSDPRTALVLTPLVWALDAEPEWIALEQVPGVLPVWKAFAPVLERAGYYVDTAILSAEQYGVPQTRKRAILVARRDRPVFLPAATHRPYKKGVPQHEGDQNLLPWVSMAEALGWGMNARPGLTVTVGTAAGGTDPACVGGSGARKTLYGERDAGRWIQLSNYSGPGTPGMTAAERGLSRRDAREAPSLTITSKGFRWTDEKPTDTDAIRVTAREITLLQGFAEDYPWQGNKGEVFQQVGNAFPPPMADSVLTSVLADISDHWVVQTMQKSLKHSRRREDAVPYERDMDAPAPTVTGASLSGWKLINRRDSPAWQEKHGTRENRGLDQPAPTLTGEAHRWALRNNTSAKAAVREETEPAPTMYFGERLNSMHWELHHSKTSNHTVRGADEPAGTIAFGKAAGDCAWKRRPTRIKRRRPRDWTHTRPATTVAGDSRIWPLGHKVNSADRARLGEAEANARYGDRAGSKALLIKVEEAAVLQSFPADYPWQGAKTRKFQQVGNAVPPVFAAHVLGSVL